MLYGYYRNIESLKSSNVTGSSYRRWTTIFKEVSKVSVKNISIPLTPHHIYLLTSDDGYFLSYGHP